jgi:hypothetical protein
MISNNARQALFVILKVENGAGRTALVNDTTAVSRSRLIFITI